MQVCSILDWVGYLCGSICLLEYHKFHGELRWISWGSITELLSWKVFHVSIDFQCMIMPFCYWYNWFHCRTITLRLYAANSICIFDWGACFVAIKYIFCRTFILNYLFGKLCAVAWYWIFSCWSSPGESYPNSWWEVGYTWFW